MRYMALMDDTGAELAGMIDEMDQFIDESDNPEELEAEIDRLAQEAEALVDETEEEIEGLLDDLEKIIGEAKPGTAGADGRRCG